MNIEHSVGARVPLLTVIVPVYNEAPTIGRILARVLSAPYAKQVIVVDDGSTDATPDILRISAERPEVTVLTHDRNRGKGRAIRTALSHARGTYTLIQDADVEYWPEDYPRLIEPLLAGQADVVYGSRYLDPQQRRGHSVFRYGVSLLNHCVRLLYGVRLSDEATCYKAFATSTLRAMELRCERFEFCPEVTAKACRLGLKIREVSIRYAARGRVEGKKLRFRDGIEALSQLWRCRRWPAQTEVALPSGLAQSSEGGKSARQDPNLETQTARTGDSGFHVVRLLVAVLLLVAAGLKGHQLATEPVAESSLLTSRWFLIASVEIELLLGIWLLFGVYAWYGWMAALVCFVTFAHVASYKLLIGEASCGCFGRVEVSPLWTLLLDVAVIAALLVFRPRSNCVAIGAQEVSASPISDSLVLPVTVFLAVSIPVGIAMAAYTPAALSDAGLVVGDSPFVILEPETWVGREFPLLRYVDMGEQLRHGRWLVVLYHHDCAKCQELLRRCEGFASSNQAPSSLQFALIEIPPYKPNALSARSAWVVGRLSDEWEWIVQPPLKILMEDGFVRNLVDENDVIKWRNVRGIGES